MPTVTRRLAAALALMLLPALAAAQTRGALQDGMRQLWLEHVIWTRLFIISAAAGLPDKDATTLRLMQNQTDIGNAFAGYYGEEAGAKLTALLKMHIGTAAEIVAAAKAKQATKVDSLNKKWHANAEEFADFLNKQNPRNWPEGTLQKAMYSHIDQTLAEATHRVNGDFAADVADFDAIEKHVLMLADMLTDGIVAQFPAKFAGAAKTAKP